MSEQAEAQLQKTLSTVRSLPFTALAPSTFNYHNIQHAYLMQYYRHLRQKKSSCTEDEPKKSTRTDMLNSNLAVCLLQ